MTLEERAKLLLKMLGCIGGDDEHVVYPVVDLDIATIAIREAVAAERGRCAQLIKAAYKEGHLNGMNAMIHGEWSNWENTAAYAAIRDLPTSEGVTRIARTGGAE